MKIPLSFEAHELAALSDALSWHIPRVQRVSKARADDLVRIQSRIDGAWAALLNRLQKNQNG